MEIKIVVMKRLLYPFALSALLFFVACTENKKVQVSDSKTSLKVEQKIDSLISIMTVEEKIGQLHLMNGFWDITGPVPEDDKSQQKYDDLKNGKVGAVLNITGVEKIRKIQALVIENSRLKIPLLFGYDVIHGYQTMMPIPLAESCSWDMDLMKSTAQQAAKEATSAGVNWTFAPMVDVSHDARWGRGMEGAGEDPYLASLISAARVRGFQGDLSSPLTLAACVKHFAAYGFAEAGLEYNSTEVSSNTLRNIVFPPFKSAAKAGAATFMNGFNDLGGTPVTASEYLQREILKGEWNFNGFVVSDWGSIGELVKHGMAQNDKQAAEFAINAGCDMDMESNCYTNHLPKLIKEGKVTSSLLDDAVRRVLKVKFDLGLFDDPYKYCSLEREKANLGSEEANKIALEAAKKSIVLLKNNNNLLPLKKEDKIALIGDLAFDKDSPLGSWRARAVSNSAVSVAEALQQKTQNLTTALGVKLLTKPHSFLYELNVNTNDKTGIVEAVALAKTVDKVVMVLGEDCFMSGEGRSKTEIGLPGLQLDLLKAVFQVNTNIVLVLMNGRPLTLEWENEHVPAILETWQLGNQSGEAIAQVLFGDYNPSGKLTVSFPRNVGQCPIYYNHKSTGRPITNAHDAGMVFYAHYTDSEKTPLFPFGFGLSYSTFEYTDLKISKPQMGANDTLQVTIIVENTSLVAGEEVIQLYIHDLAAMETRPIKELKKFKKVAFKAGETKTISFQIVSSDLGYYRGDEFVSEAGEFEVFVGTNSRDVLTQSFELQD